MKEIEIKNFWWKYAGSDSWALNGVDLTINEGEFVLISGPTGAGKTTLLRSIIGLIPYGYLGTLKGNIYVRGKNLLESSISEMSKIVGMVFEDPETQIIWNRVIDDIVFPLENLNLNKDEMVERLNYSLKLLNLEDKKYSSPYELSGGQKQRLSLATIIAKRPKIILLDEPTSQLDPVGRREVIDALIKLKKEYSSTIVIVEHNIDQLVKYVDRILLIDDGKIVLDDVPDKYFENIDIIKKHRGSIPEIVELSYYLKKNNIISKIYLNTDDLYNEIKKICSTNTEKEIRSNYSYTPLSNTDAIVAENLSVVYPNGTVALNNISLRIKQGEFVGIIGVNGSGKTTLVKTFNGLLKPTSGNLIILGKDIKKWDSEELVKKVGYVFQNPIHQISNRTVYDEVAFGLRNIKMPENQINARVMSALKRFGLEHLKDKHPYTISRADQFRVVFASVIVMDPEIIIVDEPTTGQDLYQSYQIMNYLKEENQKGKTIIVITHHLRFISQFVPRTIILLYGNKIYDGATQEAFENYEIMQKSMIDPPELSKLSYMLKNDNLSCDVLNYLKYYNEYLTLS
jgi:energy-coupling factor transport system ATP-binding protein